MEPHDHRSRVAAEKRERMRLRLLESALEVFTHKGVDAAVIDDVIATAEVSRGTFYNYFRTNDELMGALLEQVGQELLVPIIEALVERTDPAERIACGVRLVLASTRRFPLFGRFTARIGIEQTIQHSLAMHYLPREIQAGIDQEMFDLPDHLIGVDLIAGSTRAAIYALTTREHLDDGYISEVTYRMLLALGMKRAKARKWADLPLEAIELPPDTLLMRSQSRV